MNKHDSLWVMYMLTFKVTKTKHNKHNNKQTRRSAANLILAAYETYAQEHSFDIAYNL